MKNRFFLFLRSGVYYVEDTTTGKPASLRTRDKADAMRLLLVKNEAARQPGMNMQIAQVYLQHGEPLVFVAAESEPSRTTRTLLPLLAQRGEGRGEEFVI